MYRLIERAAEKTFPAPKLNVYEIYTTNPETGEGGWDIEWVRATAESIANYPHFDCIITTIDYPMSCDGSNITDFPYVINCGACTVAIGAHTNDENCRKGAVQ